MANDQFTINFTGLKNLLQGQDLSTTNYGGEASSSGQPSKEASESMDYDGLPSDNAAIMKMQHGLESGAIPSTESNIMKFQHMVNNHKYWKEQFNKYNEKILSNQLEGEIAISGDGSVLLNIPGKGLQKKRWNEITENMQGYCMTYGDVAKMRENDIGLDNPNSRMLMEFISDPTGKSQVFKHIEEQAEKLANTKQSVSIGYQAGDSNVAGENVFQFISNGHKAGASQKEPNKEQLLSAYRHIANSLSVGETNRLRVYAKLNKLDPNGSIEDVIYNAFYAFNDIEYSRVLNDAINERLAGKKGAAGDSEKDKEYVRTWTDLVMSATNATKTKLKWKNVEVEANVAENKAVKPDGKTVTSGEIVPLRDAIIPLGGMIKESQPAYIGGKEISIEGQLDHAYLAENKTFTEYCPWNPITGTYDTAYIQKLAKLKDAGDDKNFKYNGQSYRDLKKRINEALAGATNDPGLLNAWFRYNDLPLPYKEEGEDINHDYQLNEKQLFDLNKYVQKWQEEDSMPFVSFEIMGKKSDLRGAGLQDGVDYFTYGSIKDMPDSMMNSALKVHFENLYKIHKNVVDKGIDASFWVPGDSVDDQLIYTKVYMPVQHINDPMRQWYGNSNNLTVGKFYDMTKKRHENTAEANAEAIVGDTPITYSGDKLYLRFHNFQ